MSNSLQPHGRSTPGSSVLHHLLEFAQIHVHWVSDLTVSSNHLILCHPLLLLQSIFPSVRVFSNESVLGGQSIGASALASVHPMNIQGWFPSELTGLISLQPKSTGKLFFNCTSIWVPLCFLQFPRWNSGKESAWKFRTFRRRGFDP